MHKNTVGNGRLDFTGYALCIETQMELIGFVQRVELCVALTGSVYSMYV